jgi:cytidyltransferase-like protein
MKKVMVFGVFDGVHEGHRHLFREAKKHGGYLIVAVAQDHVVEYLKGCLPDKNLARRIDDLRKESAIDEVAVGDAELSVYEVVKKHKPDVIALGYDQAALKEDLGRRHSEFDWHPKIIVAKAHKPDECHSSLLRRQIE